MKGRLKEFALKLFALTLAITISIPSNVYAIGLSKNKNKQMPTSIRIADNSEYEDEYVEENETNEDTSENIVLSETDRRAYKISHKASLNDDHDGIIYTIKVEKIKDTDHDPERKMTLSLATNKNQSLRDINVKEVRDLSEDGANIDYREEKNDKDGLNSLAITSPSVEKSIEYVLEAPIDKKAIDSKKLYSVDMSLDIDGYNIDLQRISHKFVEFENEDDPDLKELRLTSVKEKEDDLRQIAYIKEDEDGKDDRIVYTDCILSKDKADEESKSLEKNKIEYKISLDNIKKEDAEIKLDYYKAGEKGFEIQREFSTNIPYQEKVDLDVPAGYLLKLSLVGKIDKTNTKTQNYGVNGRTVKSPRFVKEEEKFKEDDEDPAEESKDEKEAKDKKAKDEKEAQEKSKAADKNKKTEAEKKSNSDKKTELENNKSADKENKNNKESKTEDKSEGKEKSAEEDKEEETSENKSEEKEEKTSNKDAENNDKKTDKNEASKKEENKTPATIEEKKEKKKEFDQLVENKKEEAKKDSEGKDEKKGLLDGVKSFFGQTDLKKADKELKKALADESKGLAEIQKLLTSFGEKYKLSRADQAKLMDDNASAIKKLIEKDADINFDPSALFARANETNTSNLENKKFTIRTRFDTSTRQGPIPAGQYFNIHLDKKLTVKDPSSLEDIIYKGNVIAKPSYDQATNTIKYEIVREINEDINKLLSIDVDYNTKNITDGESFTVINSISGLGVTNPKLLPAEKIDKNGNPAGTIIEEGGDDVVQIIGEDDEDYKINIDILGNPVVDGNELSGINWTLRVNSTVDLVDLGYKLNLTTVEGSGLGEIQNVKINGKPVNLTDQLEGQLGIADSKHHDLKEKGKTLVYTFYTPRENKQGSYMIDVSTILTKKKNKVGAIRHILNEGYPQEKIEENSPNRTSMNNRTTIKGEFKSEKTAEWTITDAVSTGDTNKGLPLETRTLENQSLATGKRAVYGINTETGQMEVKTSESSITNVPAKETDPKGAQAVGNIGVYKFNTNLNTPNDPTDYSVGGVTISKYKDIIVDQHWSLADGYEKMPAQSLTVKDNKGSDLGEIDLKEEDGHQRLVTIPNVRFWNIGNGGKSSMIDHKISQPLSNDIILVADKKYTFKENANYYDVNSKTHYITNALIEKNDKIPATFTVIKVDANNPEKRIPGANFYLLGAEISITTDSNGEATFNNVKPGTYTLKETKAPAGYKLDQEGKTITISDDGKVSISGKNAQFSSGSGKTDILEHSDYPNWKDFMNTQHYGKVDENGNLKFYVYLKPYDQRVGGRTDKDTTFNISIPGVNLQDSNIKVYDVNSNQRPDIFASMNNQSVDQKLSSLGKITLGAPNNNGAIEGKANTKNPLSGNTSYQITFPQGRFGDNWGFLVEVSADIGNKDSTVLSYDWLAKESPAGQSKIRANVNLSKNSDENGHPTITISNGELQKSEIEVAKFADTSTDGKKDRLGGAEFVLKNENREIIANKIADEKGKVSFGKYPTGTYYLEELKAPEGYEKSNVYFVVKVSEDGQVSYNAKFKDSDSSPTAGVDYYIEREKGGQAEGTAVVTSVNQSMVINDDEGSGNFRGVWEAYRLESLKYHLDATISNAAPGSRFEIQFDPNLDFTQYFKTFPNLYFKGKMIAEPYFNYKTNLLTYVFNENSLSNGETKFSLDLKGMIPSKFYATHSGDWNFTNVVAPNQSGTISGNPVENITVHADYDGYDKHTTVGKFPSQAYYFRDVYKADDGNWYVKAIGYYNPLGDYKTGNANKIWFNWKFANYQGAQQEKWQGQYDSPYYLDDVKIYETTIPPLKKYEAHRDYYPQVNDYMPLSMGVRPEQNPDIYSLVYHAQIDHTKPYNRSQGGFNLSYEPNKVTSSGPLYDTQNPPLTISVPKINPTRDAYLIEQTFRIRDINEFNKHWRAFYMANGEEKSGNRANSLNSSFVTGPNDNYSKADQTGEQLPSFTKEVVGIINKKYQPASFKITKLNEANQNEKLQNATFVLTDSENNKIYRTSDQNGEISFDNLAPGKYTLREYRAPDGYIKSTKEWKVTVYSDGNVKITSTSIIGGGEEYTGKDTINIPVTNKPVGEKFRVYKKDGDGQPLPGAKFKITDPDDSKFSYEATSGQNGIAEFDATLKEGKNYILEEIEPPAGYKPINKKWVLRIENGKTKIYTYSKSDTNVVKSILGEDGTHWINVKERPTAGWSSYDNRLTGWTANSSEARYLGTRIVAINKDKNYVIQRYVINPEARKIANTTAIIHREKPEYPNMDWYKDEEYKVFTLDPKEDGNTSGKVTGLISDLRLADFKETDITSSVTKSVDDSHFGESRLKLELPSTTKPIVIDVKIPYKNIYGGVGTGMDWYEGGQTYWKSDYYERVSDILESDPTTREEGSIIGSYVAEGSLDVTNEIKTYGFKIKKVREIDKTKPIQGAVFKLTGPGDSPNERYMTTGAGGMISFNNLKPGIYKLEEEEPAPGYQKKTTTWTIRVANDGKVYIKDNSQSTDSENSSFEVSTPEKSDTNNLMRRLQMAGANSDLEISGNLVDTLNPLRAASAVTYDILGTISDVGKKYVKVSTNAKYLGNDEFLVRIDVKGNLNADRSDVTFDLQLHDDVTFVPNSTITWKENANDKNQVPNNPSRWHTGYDSNTKKIGVRDGAISINKGDTASIEFKVTMKSNLNVGQTGYIIKSLKVYNTDCDKLRAKKFDAYIINQNAQNGTIITNPIDAQRYDQPVTFTAKPNPGYKLVGNVTVTDKTGGDVPIRNGNTFTMPKSDVTINAKFEAETYNITYNNSTGGSVSGNSTAKTGEKVSLNVNPREGYKLKTLVVTDGKGNNVPVNKNQFTMPAGKVSVSAEFEKIEEKTYNVYTQTPKGGTLTVDKASAKANETITVTAEANEDYELNGITYRDTAGDEHTVTGNSFTMPASDVTVSATFVKKEDPNPDYNVKVNPAENGQVNVTPSSAKAGDKVIITSSPSVGFELDTLTVTDGSGKPVQVSNNSFTMPAEDVTVSATFKKSEPQGPQEGETEIPSDGFATITNKQTGLDLKILKRGSDGRILEKAEFTLEKYTDGTYKTKDDKFKKVHGISDANGNVKLVDDEGNPVSLPVGFYRLTETKSPLGYKKPQAPFDIEVYQDAGQLKAKYKGPKHTSYDYINDDKSYDNTSVQTADNGIKYKSKLININTESKTYIQRIYIDTRRYTGDSDKINIQISPKYKREETDRGPGNAPTIDVEGVKTAYRSTYKITGAPNDDSFADTVLNNYDLSKNNVTMLNTARWRPFDWGFDEDIMNLDKGGVYYIDVEGFYDDAILTGIDNHQSGKETITNPEDLQKLELNFDFYDGAREFQQAVGRDNQGNIIFKKVKKGSYQAGNLALGLNKFEKSPDGQLGKTGGRIYPKLTNGTRVQTSIDLESLYSSKYYTEIPQSGMNVVNEVERYNVTFSKHGRDNPKDAVDSENVTTNRLEGAIFKLEKEIANTYVDVEGSYVGSAFNGYFGFRNLEPGRYRLKEVKAPEGYKPITDPLLYFTIKTVNTNSGDVVDPETGDTVDIKTINVRFESGGTTYILSNLKMVDAKDSAKKLDIKDVESKDINIEKSKIVNPDTGEEVLLKDMIVVGREQFKEDGTPYYKEYPVKQIKIVPASSGYISLEYNNANGVYQYVPEDKTSAKDGKLIDFVTSATAKNMGKIINEKPDRGSLELKKVDDNRKALSGAEFKLTDITTGNTIGLDGKAIADGSNESLTVGRNGTLNVKDLEIGSYRLVETKSPEGHINTDQEWNFTIGGKDLDPYFEDNFKKTRDISKYITLDESKLDVLSSDRTDVINPNANQSLVFRNKFKVSDIKINPGDYFTVKLSKNLDLNGVLEENPSGLDIVETGVGTIAKGEYDEENHTITYTFTNYAKTYDFKDFDKSIRAFINRNTIKENDKAVSVGLGIKDQDFINKTIEVAYDIKTSRAEDDDNHLSLDSGIASFNPSTGDFVHYYYINKDSEQASGLVDFTYTPGREIDNLNIRLYKADKNNMPSSFDVDENSIEDLGLKVARTNLEKGSSVGFSFEEGIKEPYLVKVTGKLSDSEESSYLGYAKLVKPYKEKKDLYVERKDDIYSLNDKASARKEMSFTAVNPANKINFRKVDQDGKALQNAKFKLKYRQKAEDEWSYVKDENNEDLVKTSGKDGKFDFTKLKPGFYELEETAAPDGYNILTNPAYKFVVNDNGKIITKTIGDKPGEDKDTLEEGLVPIYIENKKDQHISFKKVDADDNSKILPGAEFKVLYKDKADGKYAEYKVDGNTLTATSDKEGKFSLNVSKGGYYALEETKAPDGYSKYQGYIKEFKLENGKIQVLEKDPLKASFVKGSNGKLTSEILEVDKDKGTFKQRLVINPNHTEWKFDKYDTLLQLDVNNWNVSDQYRTIKVATLEKGKTVADLKEADFKEVNPRNQQYSTNPLIYSIPSLYNTNDYTQPVPKISNLVTEKGLVVEITGKITDKTQAVDLNPEVYSKAFETSVDKVNYRLDINDMSEGKGTYVDYESKDPIQVENTKVEYPFTGGPGVWIGFAIIGLIVMLGGVLIYTKKKKEPLS